MLCKNKPVVMSAEHKHEIKRKPVPPSSPKKKAFGEGFLELVELWEFYEPFLVIKHFS